MPSQQARNWFYTLNNPTDHELDLFRKLPEFAVFHLFGHEVGKCGTPHLQGTIGYSKRMALGSVKKHFSGRMHLEPTRDVLRSIEYCSKDGRVERFGDVPTSNRTGQRTDLEEFKETVKSGVYSHGTLLDQHSDVMARYPRFCMDYVRQHRPLRPVQTHPLRPWQARLQSLLEQAPDSRTIVFVIGFSGNEGKSWFVDWWHFNHPSTTQVINPSKKNDMAFALDEDKTVFFFDAPRSKQGEFIQYDILEELKNGRVFSPKYESGMKYFNPAHVVVMMNEEPEESKLSVDRVLKLYCHEP